MRMGGTMAHKFPALSAQPAKKIMRWSLGAAATAVVIVLLLSAVAYALLDEDLLKRELTRALGRPVEFSGISAGLLRITLTDMQVGELAGFEPDPLLAAKNIDLRYSILSILRGKLVIDRVVVTEARLGLERRSDGTSNFDDLTRRSKDGSILVVREMGLDNVEVAVRLDTRIIEVKSLQGKITNLSERPNLFDLDGLISGARVHVDGEVDAESYAGRMKILADSIALDPFGLSSETVNLAGLAAAIDGELGFSADTFAWNGLIRIPSLAEITGHVTAPWKDPMAAAGAFTAITRAEHLTRIRPARPYIQAYKASGGIQVDLALSGESGKLPTSVSGELLDLSLTPPGMQRVVTMKGRFRADPEEAHLDNMSLITGDAPLRISGVVGYARGTVDLKVAGKSLDLGALAALIPQSPLPEGSRLSGNGSIDLAIKGKTSAPLVNGLITMEGMALALAKPKTTLENLRGKLNLSGDDVKLEGVTARMKSMTVTVSGTYDRKSEKSDLKVKADNIVLSELPEDLGSGTLDVKGAASFDGSISGKASEPIVKGKVSSGKLELFGIPISDLAATLSLDGPSIELDDLRAVLLGGEITGDAGFNILSEARPFQLNLSGKSLDFGEVIALATRFTGAKFNGISGGVFSGNIAVSAPGSGNPATFTGSGSGEALNVDLGGVKLLASLAQALGGGQLGGIGEITQMISGEKFERFQSIRGSFTIDGGKVRINEKIRFRPFGDHAIAFRGSVGLDGSLGGLIADMTLPEKWFKSRAGATALMMMGGELSGGTATLPVSFAGTFAAPRPEFFKPDPKNLLKIMGLPGGVDTSDTAPSDGGIRIPTLPGLGTTDKSDTAADQSKSRTDEVFEKLGDLFKGR